MEFDDEYVARLRPVVDSFSDEDLYRVGRCDGPRIYALLDEDGLPTSGVIYDPETGTRMTFRIPMPGEAVA